MSLAPRAWPLAAAVALLAVPLAAESQYPQGRARRDPPAVDAPAPSAMQVIAGLAEDDRMRAEAMGDLVAKLKVLYDALSPKQRTLFDRRVLLAQSEPLGTQ